MDKIYETTEKRAGFDKALYTKVVWAGRRRYFFDVLSTRAGDKYISITESRKKMDQNGGIQFENQKLFLFKEDFEKFSDALVDVLAHIRGESIEEVSVDEFDPTKEYRVDDLNFENL